ncbi:hypothetical protein SUDANB95_02976 [Actinosynnema sp. ALI-1.44]
MGGASGGAFEVVRDGDVVGGDTGEAGAGQVGALRVADEDECAAVVGAVQEGQDAGGHVAVVEDVPGEDDVVVGVGVEQVGDLDGDGDVVFVGVAGGGVAGEGVDVVGGDVGAGAGGGDGDQAGAGGEVEDALAGGEVGVVEQVAGQCLSPGPREGPEGRVGGAGALPEGGDVGGGVQGDLGDERDGCGGGVVGHPGRV